MLLAITTPMAGRLAQTGEIYAMSSAERSPRDTQSAAIAPNGAGGA